MKSPSRLEVLTLLDAYNEAHETGNDSFKSTLWNLTKARQYKGDLILASDIREDLIARTVLKLDEPKLVEEQNEETGDYDGSCGSFHVVDAVQERQLEKENAAQAETSTTASTNTTADTGLRNRKGGTATTTTTNAPAPWKVELLRDDEDASAETRLQDADPINLFGGLVPRELRTAQQEAKKTLEAYIRAANLKRLLETKLKE